VFELIQLRCFVAVAEELHFGRAAARLNMTQPPLSRHIQVLERIMKVELFYRSSRSVRLTAAGTAFLAEARRVVRMADSAVATARAAAEGRNGLINLGFTAASGYGFLSRFIAKVGARAPDVRFVLKEMVSDEQLESLLAGRIDLGFLRPPVRQPELVSQSVLREKFIICSPASVAEGDRPKRLADFDNLPFIMYAPDKARYFHDLLTGMFTGAGAEPRHVQYLAQIHTILMLVGAGHGFALVPESSHRLHPDGVVFSDLEDAQGIVELYATWRRDADNPALLALVPQLTALCAPD
jgi:DNA-binding transcriptional LysR family regulator